IQIACSERLAHLPRIRHPKHLYNEMFHATGDRQSISERLLVPGVEVTAPASGSDKANVKLINRSGGIGRVIVKVNGRELPSATRGTTPDTQVAIAQLTLDLSGATLAPSGQNVIEVFAESGDGLIRSRGV